MSNFSRRDFLKLCGGTVAAVSLSQVLLPELVKAAPALGSSSDLDSRSKLHRMFYITSEFRPAGDERDLTEIVDLNFIRMFRLQRDMAMKVIDETRDCRKLLPCCGRSYTN